jgi:hypothetical protein
MTRTALPLAAALLAPFAVSADPLPLPLREALLARAGEAPVYLAAGDGGLVASAADGAWSRVLVAGDIGAAALDDKQDLVWLVRGGRLEVLDLREPDPAPVPIVERWYKKTDTYVSAPVVVVTGVSSASTDTSYAGIHPVLSWKDKPRITTGEGAYGGIWEDQDALVKKVIKKAKIVGGPWLQAHKGRAPRAVPARPASPRPAPVKLPSALLGECEDEQTCGEAEAFGATGWSLVVVSHTCGDACHTSCVLHDPATKTFASPTSPGRWGKKAEGGSCLGYVFDATGTRWVVGDQVCTTTTTCAAIKNGEGFAWLGPGPARTPGGAAPATAATAATAPVPFTAAQIRDAMALGTEIKVRVEELGKPTVLLHWRVTAADATTMTMSASTLKEDGSVLADKGTQSTPWETLVKHATFPAAETVHTTGSVTVPAGTFETLDYTVTQIKGGATTVSFYRFAKTLPGPPVFVEVKKDGVTVRKMTLLARGRS